MQQALLKQEELWSPSLSCCVRAREPGLFPFPAAPFTPLAAAWPLPHPAAPPWTTVCFFDPLFPHKCPLPPCS